MRKLLLALVALLIPATVHAQVYQLAPVAHQQFFTNNGQIAAGYKLCTFAAGSTTPQAAYSDNMGTALPNPITLNSAGRPQTGGGTETGLYLSTASYKFILYASGTGNTCNGTQVGALVWSQDNISLFSLLTTPPVLDCSAFSGTTADAKINNCIGALPSTGGTADARRISGTQTLSSSISITIPVNLLLGPGTYTGSPDPLINVSGSAASGTSIVGLGRDVTNLVQSGSGRGIVITDGSDIDNVRVLQLTINGNGTGSKGIDTNSLKNGVIEDFRIIGFLNHSISFSGVSNLNNVVMNGRIAAGSGALTSGRGIYFAAGNGERVENVYVNAGGTITTKTITNCTNAMPIVCTATGHGLTNGQLATVAGVLGNLAANGEWTVATIDANTFSLTGSTGSAAYVSGGSLYYSSRYSTAVEATSSVGNLTLIGNIYDTVVTCVKTAATTGAFQEYVDLGSAIFGYYPVANNVLNVSGSFASSNNIIFNPGNGVSGNYIHYRYNDSTHGNVVGSLTVNHNYDQTGYPSTAGLNIASHLISKDTTTETVLFDSFGTNNQISLRRADGTFQAPTAVQSGETLGQIGGAGYNSSPGYNTIRSAVVFGAGENWTSTNQGAFTAMYATQNGTTSATESARFINNGGNGSLLVNTTSTDFSSAIVGIQGTTAIITANSNAAVIALNASGGDGNAQIVTTHSGGGLTKPLEIFYDSTKLVTFNASAIQIPIAVPISYGTSAALSGLFRVPNNSSSALVTRDFANDGDIILVGITDPSNNMYLGDSTHGNTLILRASAGVTVGGATTTTGVFDTLGRVFMQSLNAEGGTKSALCHDDISFEVLTNPAATCTVSSLRFKNWLGDLSCKEARRIVKAAKPGKFQDKDGADGPRFGFAAEDMAKVEPKLVYYERDGKTPRAIDYERYTAVLTKVIQCQ